MKIKKILLVTTLSMTLVISQLSFAAQGSFGSSMQGLNNNQMSNQSDTGFNMNMQSNSQQQYSLRSVQNYSDFSQASIYIDGETVDSSYSPVVQSGTTLIPVRAISEALGASVYWYEPYVVIIDEDEETVIIFDMESGDAYVIDDPEDDLLEIGDADEDDAIDLIESTIEDETAVEMDVPAGLVNNSTYVPLRFIAEEFGMNVGYDATTKHININSNLENTTDSDSPTLNKTRVTLVTPKETAVEITLNDYELVDVYYDGEALDEGDDYDLDEDDDVLTVTLLEDFIDQLDDSSNTVSFVLENDDDDEITLTLKLTLAYLEEEPVLTPGSIEFDEGALEDIDEDYLSSACNLLVNMALNGWTFVEIDGLDEDDEYTVNSAGTRLTLDEDYLNALDNDDYALEFIFEAGDNEVSVYLDIEVN